LREQTARTSGAQLIREQRFDLGGVAVAHVGREQEEQSAIRADGE
jgi:hypothetical protein